MNKIKIVFFSDKGEIAKAIKDLLPEKFLVVELYANLSDIKEVIKHKTGPLENAGAIIINLSQGSPKMEKQVSSLQTAFLNTPLIILHHYKQKTFALAFIKMGAKAYLPIQMLSDELLPAIESVLSDEVFISKSVC